MRIDVATHRELKKLASTLGASVGDTVTLAVRRLRQDQIAADLRGEMDTAEVGSRAVHHTGWAALHGFVMLEVHGHLSWLATPASRCAPRS